MDPRSTPLCPLLAAVLLAACGGGSGGSAGDGASGVAGVAPGTGGTPQAGGGLGGSGLSSSGGTSAATGGNGARGPALGGAGTSTVGGSGVAGVAGTALGTGGSSAGTTGTGGSHAGTTGGAGGSGNPGATGGAGAGTAGAPPSTGGSPVAMGGSGAGTAGATTATGGHAGGTGGSAGTGGQGAGSAGRDPGQAGTTGSAGTPGNESPVCEVVPASEYQANRSVGGGGTAYEESDHFIVFDATDPGPALSFLEAAHRCFVEDWCWRSAGLSVFADDGPYYKFNVYAEPEMDAGGLMHYDGGAGLAYVTVLPNYVNTPSVTVHEYGHALTLSEHGWVDQTNTGFWWESVANFVADTFLTSPLCEPARDAFGVAQGRTLIDLDTVIGNAQWTVCMNQNYYQAWPFFTYLTNNPDQYPGLGTMTLPNLFRNHLGNNETPLHVLERLAEPVTVQAILGRYWARMAYLDIGHPQAQDAFFDGRDRLNFNNLTALGNETYEPLTERQPRYGGANIIPLEVTGNGEVSVQITNLGNGLPESGFTATLSLLAEDRSVRYVDLPEGAGQAMVAGDEEVSLVIVNTPDTLYMYDPSTVGPDPSSAPENTGLSYQVQITGATPTH